MLQGYSPTEVLDRFLKYTEGDFSTRNFLVDIDNHTYLSIFLSSREEHKELNASHPKFHSEDWISKKNVVLTEDSEIRITRVNLLAPDGRTLGHANGTDQPHMPFASFLDSWNGTRDPFIAYLLAVTFCRCCDAMDYPSFEATLAQLAKAKKEQFGGEYSWRYSTGVSIVFTIGSARRGFFVGRGILPL
jgi:hypothetical protein